MTVGIPRSDRDDSDLGMRSLDPRRARAVRAAVVRDLHDMHVGNRPVAQPIIELVELRVSGEEGVELAPLDEHAHRGVVLVLATRGRKDTDVRVAERDGARGGSQILRSARLNSLHSSIVYRRVVSDAIV